MATKKPVPHADTRPSQPGTPPPRPERKTHTMNFIELRPGLFLNADHIVSVRVLPQDEGNAYAILQLSSGEKQNLTRDEFVAITGEEPRLPARLSQRPLAK